MGPIDSLKEAEFCGSIGNPRAGKREPGDLPQDDDDPKQSDEPFDPAARASTSCCSLGRSRSTTSIVTTLP
jgi:hypothetical protein